MRYLLDTHALLWWITDSPQLSDEARRLNEAWESMSVAQRELFTTTYLEDRYRPGVPAGLSTPESELLAKAYWFSLKSLRSGKQ